jgi:hypothetical protein
MCVIISTKVIIKNKVFATNPNLSLTAMGARVSSNKQKLILSY